MSDSLVAFLKGMLQGFLFWVPLLAILAFLVHLTEQTRKHEEELCSHKGGVLIRTTRFVCLKKDAVIQ